MGSLIPSARELVKPYVVPILRSLQPRLRDSNQGIYNKEISIYKTIELILFLIFSSFSFLSFFFFFFSVFFSFLGLNHLAVASCVLGALGSLAEVGQQDMEAHLNCLLPIILETIKDQSSPTKREVALRTFGQLISCTGNVISPYYTYPTLMDTILNLLSGGSNVRWELRRETIRVIGILGALDPHQYKIRYQQKWRYLHGQLPGRPEEDTEETKITRATGNQKAANDGHSLTHLTSVSDILPSMVSPSEDYFSTVAITALMGILRDNSLSTQHNMVIQAVMFIVKSLGLKCVPYLPQILPPFLNVVRHCEASMRESLFQQLGVLVSIVRQHIRGDLDQIFQLIKDFWDDHGVQLQILSLVEGISLALKDEFKVYLPDLLPQLLALLSIDHSEQRRTTLKALHTLVVLGHNLEDYLYLVIPAIVRVCEQHDVSTEVRSTAISALSKLSRVLNFGDYASKIVHPLVRIIDEQTDLQNPVLDALCSLALVLCQDYIIFIGMVEKALVRNHISHNRYKSIVAALTQGNPLSRDSLSTISGALVGASTIRESEGDVFESIAEFPVEENIDIGPVKKLHVNQQNLKKTWESSQRSTKEDWKEWMRRLAVELLRESPSPALRSCSALGQV